MEEGLSSFFFLSTPNLAQLTPNGLGIDVNFICQISVEEQGRSLVIKIDREAVMKIAVNGDLFTLKKGMHELNLTLGGVPFRADGLVNQVLVFLPFQFYNIHKCSCLASISKGSSLDSRAAMIGRCNHDSRQACTWRE